MSLPQSVKFSKDGVTYESNVDATKYTMHELCRAAMRDCGKFICKTTRKKIRRRTGKVARNTQYWVLKREKYPCLRVGFKPGGFYGGMQEVGTTKIKKIAVLSTSVEENIDTIRKIQGQYLSAINDDNYESKINEEETISND